MTHPRRSARTIAPVDGAATDLLPDSDIQARLMTLFSPSLPIGGFAWSHGLEAAIAERLVSDLDTLVAWIGALVRDGSGWNDLVLLAEAHRATASGEENHLLDVAELGTALAGSAERRAETLSLGEAFLEATEPYRATGLLTAEPLTGRACPHPVAAGSVAACLALPRGATCTAFAQGFVTQLVSAAARLVPLSRGAQVTAQMRLEPAIARTSEHAAGATLDDLGSASLGSDIAAMRHETLHTRLFRS